MANRRQAPKARAPKLELRFAIWTLKALTMIVSAVLGYALVSSFDPPLWALIESLPTLWAPGP